MANEEEMGGRSRALSMMKKTLQHGMIRRAMQKRKMAESPEQATDELSHEDDLEEEQRKEGEGENVDPAVNAAGEETEEEMDEGGGEPERRTLLEVFTPRTEQRREEPFPKRKGR